MKSRACLVLFLGLVFSSSVFAASVTNEKRLAILRAEKESVRLELASEEAVKADDKSAKRIATLKENLRLLDVEIQHVSQNTTPEAFYRPAASKNGGRVTSPEGSKKEWVEGRGNKQPEAWDVFYNL